MKHLIQPIQDILTTASSNKSLKSSSAQSAQFTQSTQGLDLEGIQKTLNDFDSYLNQHLKKTGQTDALAKTSLPENSGSSTLSSFLETGTHITSYPDGKESPSGGNITGNDLPLSASSTELDSQLQKADALDANEGPEPASYFTAAHNLVDRLSAVSANASSNASSNDQPIKEPNALDSKSEDTNLNQNLDKGLFESPIYQSLINGQNFSGQPNKSGLNEQIHPIDSPAAEPLINAAEKGPVSADDFLSEDESAQLAFVQNPDFQTAPVNKATDNLASVQSLNAQYQNKVSTQPYSASTGQHKAANIESTVEGTEARTSGSEIESSPNLDNLDSGIKKSANTLVNSQVSEPIRASYANPGESQEVGFTRSTEAIKSQLDNLISLTETAEVSVDQSPDLEASELNNLRDSVSAALSSAAKSADSQPNSQSTVQLRMNTPVTQDGWNQEFVMRVRSLASIGEQQASLQLNPSELGSVEIQMTTEGDKAKVHFVVQTTNAREVLENNLPKLREFFEESGMTLSDTGVEDQSGKQGHSPTEHQEQQGAQATLNEEKTQPGTAELKDNTVSTTIEGRLNNRIDFYI